MLNNVSLASLKNTDKKTYKNVFITNLGGGSYGANAHNKKLKINTNSPATNGRDIKNKQALTTSLVSVGWK